MGMVHSLAHGNPALCCTLITAYYELSRLVIGEGLPWRKLMLSLHVNCIYVAPSPQQKNGVLKPAGHRWG